MFDSGAAGFTSEIRSPASWSATGGDPDGHVSGKRSIQVPTGWTGDRSGAYGGRFDFSVRTTGGAYETPVVTVGLSAGQEYVFTRLEVPTGRWTKVWLPLTTSAGWLYQNRGPDTTPATADQLRSVLSHVGRIDISVEDGDAARGLDIDSVVLAGRVERSSTIRRAGGGIAGTVSASAAGCAAGVPVRVVGRFGGGTVQVARTRTRSDGSWALRRSLAPGQYQARLDPRFVGGAGQCAEGYSRIIRLR